MTLRELPNFLKQRDKNLALPRAKPFSHIGQGFAEVWPIKPKPSHQPRRQEVVAWCEWLEHVREGWIG